MKRRRIAYSAEWLEGPMTYWVHRPIEDRQLRLLGYDAPAPKPVAGRGFASYFVDFDGFEFRFASLLEMDVCIEALGQKVLPQLDRSAGGEICNSHWLSRLPGHVLPWKYRERAVAYLRECRHEFEEMTNG